MTTSATASSGTAIESARSAPSSGAMRLAALSRPHAAVGEALLALERDGAAAEVADRGREAALGGNEKGAGEHRSS